MAMTKLQRITLTKTLEVLTEDLDVIPAIIHLKSKGVLNENDGENIIAKVTEEEKVMEFLKIIKKRGTRAYSIFHEYLKNCPGSEHLAKEMDNNSKEVDSWKKLEDKFHNFKCTHETISSYLSVPKKINIVLIGKTGSGKSATGNTICGSFCFKAACSSQSETKTTQMKSIAVGGINITVIDTPGLFDTAKSDGNEIIENENLMFEITKTIISFNKGIHLFLVVCSPMGKFTKEEQESIKMIEEILSKDIYSNCAVILTNANAKFGGNQMGSLKEYVQREIETGGKFADLLKQVKGNIIAVENCFDDDFSRERHREKFLCFLAQVIEANKGSVYSNKLFEAAHKREEELENERQKRVKRENDLTKMKKLVHDFLITKHLNTLSEQQLGSVSVSDIEHILHQPGVLTLESITRDDVREYVSCFFKDNRLLIENLKDMKLQESRKKRNELEKEVTKRRTQLQTAAFRQISLYIAQNMESFLREKTKDDLISLKADIKQEKVPEEIKTLILTNLSTELKESLSNEAIEGEILKQLESQLDFINEIMEKTKKCFAGSTVVSIKWRGNAKISSVKIGDEILVYDENGQIFYDKVYLLSHAIEDESITFIRLKTSSGKELFISPGHLLPAGNLCRNVSATDISIGDIIFTLQNSEMTSDTVTSITYELCRGAYCPMTMHGTIVVNDVAASCYTTFFPARLAHVLLSPIRFLFGYLPLHLFNGLFPYDAEEGMPILLLRCRNMITTWRSL